MISRDFFPEHKNHDKLGNFTKSVIYRDQKSEKIPKDRYNEGAVVRILIENGAEISDNSALAWYCVKATINVLTLSDKVFTNCLFLCLCGEKMQYQEIAAHF